MLKTRDQMSACLPVLQNDEKAESLKIRMPGSSDVSSHSPTGELGHIASTCQLTKWVSGIFEGRMCLVEVWGLRGRVGELLYFSI